MYYITNENHDIIATDQAILDFAGAKNFMDFYSKLQNKAIELALQGEKLDIKLHDATYTKNTKSNWLQTPMGKMLLIEIGTDVIQTEDTAKPLTEEKRHIEKPLTIEEESTPNKPSEAFEDSIMLSDEQTTAKKEKLDSTNDDIFALLDEPKIEEEETLEVESQPLKEETLVAKSQPSSSPIVVDSFGASQILGIERSDYETFFNEYIQTAHTLKENLTGENNQEKTQAHETLLHLAGVLHLPKQVEVALQSSVHQGYDEFYNVLSRLKIDETANLEENFTDSFSLVKPKLPKEDSFEQKPLEVESQDKPLELISDDIVSESTMVDNLSSNKNASIDLLDVQPEYFDFQIEEASKELNLPLVLVKEFIRDFIDQVHEETKNILNAYQAGEILRIQKLAHMLKGTSSNLRITPLAESLYNLQLNEDLNQVEPLVKKYWGQFISFERFMSSVLNQGGEK